jgi:hypothetical protein
VCFVERSSWDLRSPEVGLDPADSLNNQNYFIRPKKDRELDAVTFTLFRGPEKTDCQGITICSWLSHNISS